MIELPRSPKEVRPTRLKVVALGSAGGNTLDRLVLDGLSGGDLIAVNTDAQALAGSVAARKLQIGQVLTRGLGAGGDPEIGRTAAQEGIDEILTELTEATIVFLLAGLGGGTGSGALPVVAEVARDHGALVVAVVTLPFAFEGRRRAEQARHALAELRPNVDILICFENDRMAEIVSAKAGIQEAFALVDQTLSQCVRSLAAISRQRGLMHAGLDEVAALFREGERQALFGTGEATGGNRAHEALASALRHPLLGRGRSLREIDSAVVQISGGPDLTLNEVQILMDEVRRHLPDDVQAYCGLTVETALHGHLQVSLLGALPVEESAPLPARLSAARPQRIAAPVHRAEPEPVDELEAEEEMEEPPAPEPAAAPPEARPLPTLARNVRRTASSPPVPAREQKIEQLQLEPINSGRFEKIEPTIINGQNFDVPTFMRRNVRLK